MGRAPGIKERAWPGIMANDGRARIVHNPLNNRRHPSLYTDKSDDLPVGVQTVPKQLYVNSEQLLRKTEDVQRELILSRIKHESFNPFLTSKKG